MARFNADGTLDPTFGSGGRVRTDFGGSEVFHRVAVQDDGKILAAGLDGAWVFHFGGPVAVVRYLPDGRLDESFGTGGRQTVILPDVYSYVQATELLQLPDGRVAVGGDFWPQNNGYTRYVIMLRPDGRPDTTYGPNGSGVVTLDISSPRRASGWRRRRAGKSTSPARNAAPSGSWSPG